MGKAGQLRMATVSRDLRWREGSSGFSYLERKLVKKIQEGMRELDRLRNGEEREEDLEYCNLPDPEGIARQEAREADRGLCKINRYNPDVLLPSSLEENLRCGARLAQVLAVVTSLSASLAFKGGAERRKEDVKAEAEQLRKTLISLGPTFIKVGQVLANRPDIVRADYMEELTKLQDKVQQPIAASCSCSYICSSPLLLQLLAIFLLLLPTHPSPSPSWCFPPLPSPMSILPTSFCSHPSQVPAFSSEQAYKIIEEEIGRPISSIFEELSPEPIAAASIGQVPILSSFLTLCLLS